MTKFRRKKHLQSLQQVRTFVSPPIMNKTPTPDGTLFDNEDILPDDYPIYGNYLYVVDGKVIRSDWHDITVRELKLHIHAKEIRRCNMMARSRK